MLGSVEEIRAYLGEEEAVGYALILIWESRIETWRLDVNQ